MSQQPAAKAPRKLTGCCGRPSAALAPGCCLRRILDHSKSKQTQVQERQRKYRHLLGCSGRSSAALVNLDGHNPGHDARMAAKALLVAWVLSGHSPATWPQLSPSHSSRDSVDVSQLLVPYALPAWITPRHFAPAAVSELRQGRHLTFRPFQHPNPNCPSKPSSLNPPRNQPNPSLISPETGQLPNQIPSSN